METKTEESLEKELGGKMVPVEVELFSPFVDFIKSYVGFFQKALSATEDKEQLENFCRQAIYDRIKTLHGELSEFAEKNRTLISIDEWYEKHPSVIHKDIEDLEEPES